MERTSEGKLLELAVRVLTEDRGAKKSGFDAMYLVGQTVENQESVLGQCIWLFDTFLAPACKICLAKSQFSSEKRNYPDFAVDWREYLMSKNNLFMPEQFSIFQFPPGPVEHTGSEMIGLVEHAEEKGWRDVLLISTPFHQMRSFLSAVAATKKSQSDLRIWNCVGLPVNWMKPAAHSQGMLQGIRWEFIHTELERIKKYSANGDIATIDEGLEYLNQRDNFFASAENNTR